MTEKDREDIQFIGNIQKKARASGWGSVPREDRDKFVDIMSTSKNIGVLKKAKKLGEKEAAHDDSVNRALKKFMVGNVGASAIVGGYAANKLGKASNQHIIDELERQSRELTNEKNKAINELSGNALKEYINKDNIEAINQMYADGMNNLSDPSKIPGYLNKDALGALTGAGAAGGAAIGSLTGAGISALVKAAAKSKRNKKDKRDLMLQGDAQTPDARWKANRRAAAINAMKAKLNK